MTGRVGGKGPHKCGRSGGKLGQARALTQVAIAFDGNAVGSAFLKILHLRLGPEVGALSGCGMAKKRRGTRESENDQGNACAGDPAEGP